MKKILFFSIALLITNFKAISQVKANNSLWLAKEFSKEIALYNCKNFLFNDVLGSSGEIIQFEVIPLAAATSGELTTLLYKCDSKQKEGLILGFYGNYWNESGVAYQGYDFKNLEKTQATEFLNKIQIAIETNGGFLKSSMDNNNIYFKYEDISVLIWSEDSFSYTIRLFWKGFDATWEKSSFQRSKRRFEKKSK